MLWKAQFGNRIYVDASEYILVIHILVFVNMEKRLAFIQCVMFIHMVSYDDDDRGQPALELHCNLLLITSIYSIHV